MEPFYLDQDNAADDWVVIFNEGEGFEDDGPGDWLADLELLP